MSAQFSRTTRALAHDSARFSIAAWILGGVLLAAWLAWFCLARVTLYEVSRKARIEVQQAAHPVSAPLSRRIVASSMLIGQEVKAGELLFELDASNERLRLREEEMRLAAIPPRIVSLRKETAHREQAESKEQRSAAAAQLAARFKVDEANAAVGFARETERRLKEESLAGSVPKIDAQRAATETQKLVASRDALISEMRKLESDGQTRTSQNQAQVETLNRSVVELEGEMNTARATIERLRQDIDKHLIRAPIAGRIGDAVPLRAGTYVAEGQKLAAVIPGGDFVIVAEFNPASVLGRIRPGQRSRLRLDGFPWAQYGTLDARVTRVASEIRDNLIRVEFTPESAQAARVVMQHGLPGSIEVGLDETVPALLVLRTAGQWLSSAAKANSPGSEIRQ